MDKKLLFSVTRGDFTMQTFSVGGNGGGGKDTSNSGVRLIHKDSGAVGVGTEHRSNTKNRESAFVKLVNTKVFKSWLKMETARRMNAPMRETDEEIWERVCREVDEGITNGTIKFEEVTD